MLAEDEAGVAHHHENEVDPHSPKSADGENAAYALRLQHAVAEAGSGCRGGESRLADCNGFAARWNTLIRRDGYIDMADVILRAREARSVIDSGSAGSGGLVTVRIAVVLRDDEEPCNSEGSCVCGVDHAVKDIEASERQTVEGRLCSDMGGEEDGDEESDKGVDVHGELERRDMESGQESQEAVETRDFVQEEGESDEFGSRSQGHQVEECLDAISLL